MSVIPMVKLEWISYIACLIHRVRKKFKWKETTVCKTVKVGKEDIIIFLVIILLDMKIWLCPNHYYKRKTGPRNGQVMLSPLVVATPFNKRTLTGVSMKKVSIYGR